MNIGGFRARCMQHERCASDFAVAGCNLGMQYRNRPQARGFVACSTERGMARHVKKSAQANFLAAKRLRTTAGVAFLLR